MTCSGCGNLIPVFRAYWEVEGKFFCGRKCWHAYTEKK